MRLVVIESPYAGETTRNTEYARRALLDSIVRKEAPLASHLLYTQVLIDDIPEQRELGINLGFAWMNQTDCVVVYQDYGISKGMQIAIEFAKSRRIPIEYRKIGENP